LRAERDLRRRHQRLRPDAVEHRGQRRGRRAGRGELLHHAARHALPRHGALDRPARLDRLRPNNAAQQMTALRENSMSPKKSLAKRLVLYGVLGCMVSHTALAAVTDISSIPLATSGGSNILPNLLFDLDDSGSMQWDFMPDYVSPNTLASALPQSKPCMVDPSSPTPTACSSGCTFGGSGFVCTAAGGPPYQAGGANGFNGVAYDPNFYYRPGLGSNGQPLINPPSRLPLGSPVTTTSVADDVYFHAPFGASVTNVDLATQIGELKYCNSNSFTLCKRNGADSTGANLVSGTAFDSASSSNAMPAGQFPYRTNP